MMIIVTDKPHFRTDHLVELNRLDGKLWSRHQIRGPLQSISATGYELLHVIERFDNIPKAKDRHGAWLPKMTWRGEIAQFIYDHLTIEMSVPHAVPMVGMTSNQSFL